MDILIPRFPLHISECIISFLEFKGDYTRGELQMWAELNSYPYLKRQIAKKISIVLVIEGLDNNIMVGYGKLLDVTIERYLKHETVGLLSRCTNSFFLLIRLSLMDYNRYYETLKMTLNMDEDERRKLSHELYLGGDLLIVDVFNFLGQTPREYPRHLELLYSFEFMRLMKQRNCNPESMYVILKSKRKKRAIMSLFCTPRLLPKGHISDLELWHDYGVQKFTNPQADELQDFADNIYIKYGHHCKIENFCMRLLKASEIMMDSKYRERCRGYDFLGCKIWK